jgi:N-acetylmuramoyl-L-alanine amidase
MNLNALRHFKVLAGLLVSLLTGCVYSPGYVGYAVATVPAYGYLQRPVQAFTPAHPDYRLQYQPQALPMHEPSAVAVAKKPEKITKPARKPQVAPSGPARSAPQLLAAVGVRHSFVQPRSLARDSHPAMTPKFITIHSTGSDSMDAEDYATAMKQGLPSLRRPKAKRAGKLSWHFTVDAKYVSQHLSTTVQGGHADFDGEGNRSSIGIEMCEYRGVDLAAVMDRTAQLTAYLMWKHRIPLSHVVPHHHWARPGMRPVHKACPHFLMDNGRPGKKWEAFKQRIAGHYDRLSGQGRRVAAS